MLFNPKHEAGLRRMTGLGEESFVASALAHAFAQAERPRRAEDAQPIELDGSGARSQQPAFDFFTRTSMELCLALGAPDQPESRAVLRRLLRRIDDRRLRAALQAAIAPEPERRGSETRPRRHESLWKGLAQVGGRGGE